MAYRLHLESRRAQPPAFHFDESAWIAAAGRHPDLAKDIEVSFGWDGERLREALQGVDALIASRFEKDAVNAATSLRWIHTTGAGVDHLMPLSDLRDDLALTNSSGIHGDKAAESATMALLMLNARMPEVLANQQQRVWKGILTEPIHGKRLVLIGLGVIGQSIARAARTLGLKVTAVTRSATRKPALPDIPVLPLSGLDELLPLADFVVVTAPLTNETRHVLSASRLASLRPGAGVVNMARAALVDYDALCRQLREGRLGGAVLDVFDGEPLAPSSPYWDVPRLVVTPHITCDAPDYNQRVLDAWFDNFRRQQAGEPMRHQVDRERGY